MPTLQYRGFVLPRDYALTTDYNPTVNRTGAQEDPDATFTARIVDSVIFVDVEVDDFETKTSDQLFGYAYDLARIMTDVATIAEGIAFSPFIDEVTLPTGEVKRLVWADRGLSGLCRAIAGHGEKAVVDLVISDVMLARTISDLPIMLVWPHYAPIAAGRVADAIVRMLTGGSSSSCWAEFREALNVDKSVQGIALLRRGNLVEPIKYQHALRKTIDPMAHEPCGGEIVVAAPLAEPQHEFGLAHSRIAQNDHRERLLAEIVLAHADDAALLQVGEAPGHVVRLGAHFVPHRR